MWKPWRIFINKLKEEAGREEQLGLAPGKARGVGNGRGWRSSDLVVPEELWWWHLPKKAAGIM